MYFVGIDIGGTKCAVTLFPENGSEPSAKIRFETHSENGWRSVTDNIVLAVENIMRENGLTSKDILSAGISCGGPLDSRRGVIMCPPNLPDWDNVPVCKIISDRFGFPTFLQNDANACAIAEWRFGAGRGAENVIFLTFGTGMGAGLILDGKLYSGTNDMAGEVGHIRLEKEGPVGYGKAGSFEGFCSGGGIAAGAREAASELFKNGGTTCACEGADDVLSITAASLAKAADVGDEFSLGIYRRCGEKLGTALALLIDILNPEVIVIGSIYARSGKLLYDEMMKAIGREALGLSASVCRIVPAALGDSIGDYAAVGVAKEGYERMKDNAVNSERIN